LWPVFYVFKIVPSPIRDIFYDLIARNRYKLFGRSDTCRMPTPELQQKFLS
jgi:predicted DCC family thiol-disulfide oxidoreductase YuxK